MAPPRKKRAGQVAAPGPAPDVLQAGGGHRIVQGRTMSTMTVNSPI